MPLLSVYFLILIYNYNDIVLKYIVNKNIITPVQLKYTGKYIQPEKMIIYFNYYLGKYCSMISCRDMDKKSRF